MKLGLSYDDVLIVPKYSEIQSRKDPDTTSPLVFSGNGYMKLSIPIVSAPMDTVTEARLAIAMSKAGGAGVIHRFCSIEAQREMIEEVYEAGAFAIGAVGLGEDEMLRAKSLVRYGAHMILLDVAHAHTAQAGERVKALKDLGVKVMAGNVATPQGFEFLSNAGADAIRVGIGPGAACSTRIVTGVGYPQFTAVQECAKVKSDATLIADGGIKTAGDVAKAIAAGADTVMVGSLLAGSHESPGVTRQMKDSHLYEKSYRGMASSHAQASRKSLSYDEVKNVVAEGVSGWVPCTGPVADTLHQLVGGLRSSMSYVGASNLDEFRSNAEFIQISAAGMTESKPRI